MINVEKMFSPRGFFLYVRRRANYGTERGEMAERVCENGGET